METSRCSREAMPKTTIRPSGASAASSASKASPPLMWRTASTRSPPFASRIAAPRSSLRESTVASAPRRSTSARFSSLEARPITLAPARLASCTESEPVPPAAASTTTVSPGSSRAQRWTRPIAVRPWSRSAAAWSSLTSSGTGTSQRLVDRDLLGVAAGGEDRGDPAPVRGAAADLAAGDQRQRLLGQVVVAGGVGVGEVDARCGRPRPGPRPRRAPGRAARRGCSTSGPPNSSIWIAFIGPEVSQGSRYGCRAACR